MSGRLIDTFKRGLTSQKSSSRSLRTTQRSNLVQKSQNGQSLSGNLGNARTGLSNPIMSASMAENVKQAYTSSRETIKSSVAEVGRLGYESKISDLFRGEFRPWLCGFTDYSSLLPLKSRFTVQITGPLFSQGWPGALAPTSLMMVRL